MLKKIHLSVFVDFNPLYSDRKSFFESFKKITFFFLSLLMASTLAPEHVYMRIGVFLMFVVSISAEEHISEHVCVL